MMIDEQPKPKEAQSFSFIIPECCRELWDSCPHVVKKERPKKQNVGL